MNNKIHAQQNIRDDKDINDSSALHTTITKTKSSSESYMVNIDDFQYDKLIGYGGFSYVHSATYLGNNNTTTKLENKKYAIKHMSKAHLLQKHAVPKNIG